MYYETYKKLCELKGVRSSEVSRKTGITTATLSSWKNGKYTPGADKLQKIADYFGVSLDYLTTGDATNYYLNDETAKLAQEIFDNKEMKALFDLARDATPEDIKTAYNVLAALKQKENG